MTAAAILGIQGTRLTQEERAFFSDVQPYGYILFARNCESPDQIRALTASLRELSGCDRLPILIDQEGGRVARLKPPLWPKYPPAGAFVAMGDQSKAARAVYLNAQLIADDLYRLGITVDCTPLADLPVAGAHDIIGDRAFGKTVPQVIALARAMADGLIDGGIVPVLKHIPGHGRANADSHEELPIVKESLDVLRKTDFAPFAALADLPMAMTAHVLYTAIDDQRMATVSAKAIELIRREIGFDGLLMSDDLSMKAMQGDFTRRARDTLAAGCDVVLHCNGDMAEMKAIAAGISNLSGDALRRARTAMESVGYPQDFDRERARHERDHLLGLACYA